MRMSFKNLFRSDEKQSDGLNQAAREAIVDVLHYCMFADRHVADLEDKFIEAAAVKLNWDEKISYEYYEGKSTGAVSRALSDTNNRDALFETIKARLPGKGERELALKLVNDLVKSDGSLHKDEVAAMFQIKKLLAS